MRVYLFSGLTCLLSSVCSLVRIGRALPCSPVMAHSLCVSLRPCVNQDYVYDPEACDECSENVKFLRAVGRFDKLSHLYVSLKRSWEVLQRSAKNKGKSPAWRDSSLREFVLGRGPRPRPPSSASSAGRSSPCPSLPGEPAPGPSSAPDGALGPPAPPAAVSPAAVGLSPWSCPTYGSSSLRWRRPYALHRHLLLHPLLQLLPDLLLRLLPPFCFCATG